jgi:hypothetical protein
VLPAQQQFTRRAVFDDTHLGAVSGEGARFFIRSKLKSIPMIRQMRPSQGLRTDSGSMFVAQLGVIQRDAAHRTQKTDAAGIDGQEPKERNRFQLSSLANRVLLKN